jgi:hypothetical protein
MKRMNFSDLFHSVAKKCILGSLLLAIPSLTPLPCAAQSDDFEGGISPNWLEYDPIADSGLGGVATFSTPGNNSYRIQTSPSPAPTVVGPGRAGSIRTDFDYENFYISVDIVNWDNTRDQNIGILARLGEIGLGTTDGYAMTYQVQANDIAISGFTDEDPATPGVVPTIGNDSVTFIPGESYRMVFIGQRQQLTARVYQLPDLDTPLADITGNDINFTAGECGLITFSEGNDSTDVTFDNYFASDVEPPKLSIDISDFGDLSVAWTTNSPGYVLQGASVLESSSWTNLPGPYPVVGDQFIWSRTDTFAESTKFYRLQRP